jgi:hypothetical protein
MVDNSDELIKQADDISERIDRMLKGEEIEQAELKEEPLIELHEQSESNSKS